MMQLGARLDSMETTQIREPDVSYVNKVESEEMEVEGDAGEDAAEEHLLKDIARMGSREKMEIQMYEGNLDVEEILDWIRSLDK